jgi:hypothetical protein
MFGNPVYIFHHFVGADKNLLVDPLVGIPYPHTGLVPHGAVGIIDMTGAECFDTFTLAIE